MNYLRCPSCHKKIKYTNKFQGRQVRCPNCKQKIQLPSNETKTQEVSQTKPQATSELAGSTPSNPARPINLNTTETSAQNRCVEQSDEGISNALPQGVTTGLSEVTAEQSQDQLVINIRSKRITFDEIVTATIMGLPPTVIGLAALRQFGKVVFTVFGFSFFLGGLAALLFPFIRRTNVSLIVDRNGIRKVRRMWILPWLRMSLRFSLRDIAQLYTIETEKWTEVGGGEESRMGGNLIIRRPVRWVKLQFYSLFLLHRNGWRYELVRKNLLNSAASKIIEQKIEGFIKIPEKPVRSKWYQRVFHREKTLDEKGNLQGEGLMGKSIWMPITRILFLFLLLTIGCAIWWGVHFLTTFMGIPITHILLPILLLTIGCGFRWGKQFFLEIRDSLNFGKRA